MEMNAILHQKELENAHQKGLMGIENPMPYPSNPMAFRGRQRVPEGHEVFVHRPTLDELHSNSILMSASPYPPISTLHRERGRRAGRRPATHKSAESHAAALKGQSEDKNVGESPGAASGEEKEAESKVDLGEECSNSKTHQQVKMDAELTPGSRKNYKEGETGLRKSSQEACSDVPNSSAADKDISNQCSAFQEKFIYPPAGGAVPGMPYMFPLPANGFFPPGPSNLFLNGDHVSEDVRKWTVNDVYSFISSIPTCSEYAQTFKDHMIDGETLPLLSEEHLLDTLGLKLGPALKIRSQVSQQIQTRSQILSVTLETSSDSPPQVSRRLGNMFYMMNLPLSAATLQAAPGKPGDG
ncbi:unnamed protein product, partial [Tetraodon nigroviridis]